MEKSTFLGFFDFKSVLVGPFLLKSVKNSSIGWNKALDGHSAFYRAQTLWKIGQKALKNTFLGRKSDFSSIFVNFFSVGLGAMEFGAHI